MRFRSNLLAAFFLLAFPCAAQDRNAGRAGFSTPDSDARLDQESHADFDTSLNMRTPISERMPVLYSSRGPAREPEARSAGTVSVASLRHRVPKPAQKAFEKAHKLSAAGDYKGAAKELEKVTALDPEYAEAESDLGVQYVRLGRYQEADTVLRRAVQLSPLLAQAQANLAWVRLKLGDIKEAEHFARRAVYLSGINAGAHLVLGCILAARADSRGEGIRHLQFAARTMPQASEILQNLASK